MNDNPKSKPARLSCPNCRAMMFTRENDAQYIYRCESCVSGWFVVRTSKPKHRGGQAEKWDA